MVRRSKVDEELAIRKLAKEVFGWIIDKRRGAVRVGYKKMENVHGPVKRSDWKD